MKNYNPVRGTEDFLPREARIREIVRQKILTSYQNNGYNLISTPILEHLDFLNSSEGGDNLRLIFKTLKRKDKLDLTKPDLTEDDIAEEGLRYDLTVPLARFYASNREKLPIPFKSIQLDYSFRAERPQRGRMRQFVQCDIDILGDKSILAELDLLKTALDTYSSLGFDNITVKINDRRILNAIVENAGFSKEEEGTVCVTLDKIDKISITGVMMELIEKGFDTSMINQLVEALQDIIDNGINVVTKYGADEYVVKDMEFLIDNLRELTSEKFDIKYDVSIVRGQGYYTGPVFEIYTEGFGGAIGGGGRYDNMIEKISGISSPAVGMSIGFEPVTMLIRERGIAFDNKPNLALIYDEDEKVEDLYEAKSKLQDKYNVSIFLRAKNMKNFYEKIVEVAELVTSVKDYKEGKEIKRLN